jgi:hypothetical protein
LSPRLIAVKEFSDDDEDGESAGGRVGVRGESLADAGGCWWGQEAVDVEGGAAS